jgi:hypothetical protein
MEKPNQKKELGKKETKHSYTERFAKGRHLISRSIPVEVDLENRQVFIATEAKSTFNFDVISTDMDKLIQTYLNEDDSKEVLQNLTEARKGMEKPFQFNFIHPHTAKKFHFEYRYQIVYVKYASTRLKGELVNVKNPNLKK